MDCEELNLHADDRGIVFEPVGAAELAASRNVHVVVTHPGGVRGNHRHARAEETMVVTGPSLVRARRGETVEEVVVPAGRAFRFRFPPGTAHAIRNTGDRDTLLVAFSTRPHDPADPDTEREALI